MELFFIVLFVLVWSSSAVRFHDHTITNTRFFFWRTEHAVLDIIAVNKFDNPGLFGDPPSLLIKFRDATAWELAWLPSGDMREIVTHIRSAVTVPSDTALDKYIGLPPYEQRSRTLRSLLRPGDKFLFVSGAIFVSLFVVTWLLQQLGVIVQ